MQEPQHMLKVCKFVCVYITSKVNSDFHYLGNKTFKPTLEKQRFRVCLVKNRRLQSYKRQCDTVIKLARIIYFFFASIAELIDTQTTLITTKQNNTWVLSVTQTHNRKNLKSLSDSIRNFEAACWKITA